MGNAVGKRSDPHVESGTLREKSGYLEISESGRGGKKAGGESVEKVRDSLIQDRC